MVVNIGVVVVTKHKLVRGGGGCKTKVGEREREENTYNEAQREQEPPEKGSDHRVNLMNDPPQSQSNHCEQPTLKLI